MAWRQFIRLGDDGGKNSLLYDFGGNLLSPRGFVLLLPRDGDTPFTFDAALRLAIAVG